MMKKIKITQRVFVNPIGVCEVDQVVSCDDEQAAHLVDVAKHATYEDGESPSNDEPVTIDDVVVAIKLVPKDVSNWCTDKVTPKVTAVEAVLDKNITPEQRDQAMLIINAEND